MRVIPGEPGANTETLCQFGDPGLGKPAFGGGAALPQIDAAGASLAIKIILADQALSGEPPMSQSLSSLGKANPITVSSREKAR